MKKNLAEKLQMYKEHVEEGKSLSHICQLHNKMNKDVLKDLVNLYKGVRRRAVFKKRKNDL